jgi:hypothetical protein
MSKINIAVKLHNIERQTRFDGQVPGVGKAEQKSFGLA